MHRSAALVIETGTVTLTLTQIMIEPRAGRDGRATTVGQFWVRAVFDSPWLMVIETQSQWWSLWKRCWSSFSLKTLKSTWCAWHTRPVRRRVLKYPICIRSQARNYFEEKQGKLSFAACTQVHSFWSVDRAPLVVRVSKSNPAWASPIIFWSENNIGVACAALCQTNTGIRSGWR